MKHRKYFNFHIAGDHIASILYLVLVLHNLWSYFPYWAEIIRFAFYVARRVQTFFASSAAKTG